MLTRRTAIMGAAAFALCGFSAAPALAGTSELLNDILIGITDAVTRNYIREHWQEGRWDGHYWWHSGKRYSMAEYRAFLSSRARPAPPKPAPQRRPQPAPKPMPQPAPQPQPRPPQPVTPGPAPQPGSRPPQAGGKLNRPVTPQHPVGGMGGPGGPGMPGGTR